MRNQKNYVFFHFIGSVYYAIFVDEMHTYIPVRKMKQFVFQFIGPDADSNRNLNCILWNEFSNWSGETKQKNFITQKWSQFVEREMSMVQSSAPEQIKFRYELNLSSRWVHSSLWKVKNIYRRQLAIEFCSSIKLILRTSIWLENDLILHCIKWCTRLNCEPFLSNGNCLCFRFNRTEYGICRNIHMPTAP